MPLLAAALLTLVVGCRHPVTESSPGSATTTVDAQRPTDTPKADPNVGTPLHAVPLEDSAIPAEAKRLTACDGLLTFELRREVADVSAGVVLNHSARNLDDDRVHNETVSGAASAGDRCVLFLDSAVESPGWELSVVVSDDQGKTWRLLDAIRKPYYLAAFDSAQFESPTRGCVTVVLDDAYGTDLTPGKYEACTTDAGATWSSFALKK